MPEEESVYIEPKIGEEIMIFFFDIEIKDGVDIFGRDFSY